MSDIQHAAARKLLPILYSVATKHRPPLTYATAAKELGRGPGSARMIAQVCDLLDAAAMLAGVPMLALVAVRQADGDINRMAWRQVPERKEELVRQSQGHKFTEANIQAIETALDRLAGKSNRIAWRYVWSAVPGVVPLLPAEPGSRNPAWTRDELIITLDFYFDCKGNPPAKTSDEIRDLSLFLNRMSAQAAVGAKDFRNPNGVYMKLMNFRRFDPGFSSQGKVGLQRGGKAEEEVWNYYSSRKQELKDTAGAIRALVESGEALPLKSGGEQEGDEAEEGDLLSRVHKYRERNRKLVQKKKAKVLKETGALACEVCKFDFQATYGERGNGFIEAHHTKPLHTLKAGATTKLDDLALVCANCHRMIHAKRPWLSLVELQQVARKMLVRTTIS